MLSVEGDGRMRPMDILRGKLPQTDLQPVKTSLNENVPDVSRSAVRLTWLVRLWA